MKNNRSKIELILLLLIIAILTVGVYFVTYKVSTLENGLNNLAELQKVQPKVINGIDGQDGKDGINGKNGIDGQNGIDSKSTYIKETYYTPIQGPKGESGEDGKDGEEQFIRINPITKDLETKKSSDSFWFTLVPCSELLKSCPAPILNGIVGNE